MSNQRQGRHGERRFAELCTALDTDIDTTVNKAEDDQHGWDYIVEITPPLQDHLPADLQTHVVQCFAQIKTTKSKSLKTHVKLSNAIKAAQSPLPSFVFLLHYSSSGEHLATYGRHVWEKEIEAWLKRARQMEGKNKRALHQQKISIGFKENDLIQGNPANWILDAYEANGSQRYSKLKSHLSNDIGYGEFRHTGKLTFGPATKTEDIVALEIGLVKDLPLTKFALFDNRFGIPSTVPVEYMEDGRISLTRDSKPVELELNGHDGRQLQVLGEAWTPSMVDFGSPHFKMRVKSGFIDFQVSPTETKQSINFNYSVDQAQLIVHLHSFLFAIIQLQKAPLNFKVKIDDGTLFSGEIARGFSAEDWMEQAEKQLRLFIDVFGQKRSQELRLSYADLETINDHYRTNFCAALMYAGVIKFEGEFENDLEDFDALLGYHYGEINGWVFGVILEFEQAKRTKKKKKLSCYFKTPKIIKRIVAKQPISNLKKELLSDFETLKSGKNSKFAVFYEGNLNKLADHLLTDKLVDITIE